jgi:ATP-binding protein involved in chromosome partitioning
MPLPVELEGLGRTTLRIVWDEGDEYVVSARELRLRCACAHCVEEMTGRKLLDPTKVPEHIAIQNMSLAGNYGVQIAFTDGHDTGIYRFADLHARGQEAKAEHAKGK